MKKYNILKKNIILIIIFILVVCSIFEVLKNNTNNDIKESLIEKINIYYNKYVLTNKNTYLYNKDGYIIGKISKNIYLTLDKIDYKNMFYKIEGLNDTYISYTDVKKTYKIEKNNRYKSYIPFNENIIIKNKAIFYDKNNKFLYSINGQYDLPIILKDKDRYGVEFNNELLYIKKEDIVKTYKTNNNYKNISGIAVLNYHFFYDENDKTCNEILCKKKSQFEKELKLIKEMNLFTITMNELEMYIDGKINLPKGVLITIDDGARTKIAVDLLTEYKMNATIFLVTSWYNPKTYYKTKYIELHSHSHNLHNGGICPGGQGGEIKCQNKEILLNDLKQSREVLSNSRAFCYPFYEYNTYSEKILKEAGFTMAFIGEVNTYYGYKLAEVNSDKMKIPRFVVLNYTTINDLKNYFNEMKE